jgi:hypothetical protein
MKISSSLGDICGAISGYCEKKDIVANVSSALSQTFEEPLGACARHSGVARIKAKPAQLLVRLDEAHHAEGGLVACCGCRLWEELREHTRDLLHDRHDHLCDTSSTCGSGEHSDACAGRLAEPGGRSQPGSSGGDDDRRRKIVTVLVSFAISCATVAFTALTPGSMLWLAAAWWALSGVTFSTGNAPMMALIQTQVPNQLQGRVISLLSTVMGLAAPLGLGLAALLGEFIGVRGIFIVGGFASAAICLLGFAAPSLLRIEETSIRADG